MPFPCFGENVKKALWLQSELDLAGSGEAKNLGFHGRSLSILFVRVYILFVVRVEATTGQAVGLFVSIVFVLRGEATTSKAVFVEWRSHHFWKPESRVRVRARRSLFDFIYCLKLNINKALIT